MPITKINDLPSEILVRIFSNLCLSDRKCVRATCTRWYQLCNCLLFTRNEKFILSGKYPENFNIMIETIANSNIKCFNLEFVNAKIDDHNSYLWYDCGLKIYSLCFKNCVICESEFENIIIYCTNLKSLMFEYCASDISSDLFDRLIEEDICKDQMVSFGTLSDPWLTDYIFSKLTAIYPNLRHITLGSPSLYSNQETCNVICKLSLPLVINYIKSQAEKFEELNILHFKQEIPLSTANDLASIRNLRLKKFCLTKFNNIEMTSLQTFLMNQPNLEFIDLSSSAHFTIDNLPHLLNYCTKLRTLKMAYPQTYFQYQKVLKILAISHLESFEMVLRDRNREINNRVNELIEPQINLSNLSCENHKLRYLTGFYDLLNECDILWILKTFRNLIYFGNRLTSFKVTDKILQAIFKYQKNLQTLEIRGIEVTDNGFNGLLRNSILNPILHEDEYLTNPANNEILSILSPQQIFDHLIGFGGENQPLLNEIYRWRFHRFQGLDFRFRRIENLNSPYDSIIIEVNKENEEEEERSMPEVLLPLSESFTIQHLHSLQRLELNNCRNITDKSFKEFILPDLRYLSLKNCDRITEIGYEYIYENNLRLEYLMFESMNTLTFATLLKILRRLRRLHTLSVIKCLMLPIEVHHSVLQCSESSLRVFEYGFHSVLQHSAVVRYNFDITLVITKYIYNIFTKLWECHEHKMKSSQLRIRQELNLEYL